MRTLMESCPEQSGILHAHRPRHTSIAMSGPVTLTG
jgi:hypothetical protein